MPPLQRYKTSDPFRGLMVIINNVNFNKASKRAKRDGSDKDVDSLKKTFGQLGFEFKIHDDRTCCEMLTDLTEASSNLAEYDCLAVVILTHGEDGNIIYGVSNSADQCPIDKVLEPLKEIKKEMPKLVFVQACRGNRQDRGQCHVQADGGVGFNGRGEKDCMIVPIEVDFLYHYSSSPGFSSIRFADSGSVFIQELCSVYDECMAEGDEFNVLIPHVEINRKVAENFESNKPEDRSFHGKKQMPRFVSMLRKHLFLKRMA